MNVAINHRRASKHGGFALFFAVCISPAMAEPVATQPATTQALRLDSLLHYRVVDGLLTCSSPHPNTEGALSLSVPGHDNITLTISSVGQRTSPMPMIRLVVRDQLEGKQVSTTLLASPTTFSLARDVVSTTGEMSIEYIQSPVMNDGNGVRLYIQGFANELAQEKAVFPARDFPTFIRTHLSATDHYLRPMLAAIGAGGTLFDVPPELGAEVLADRLSPDAATAARVAALVTQLDADEPRHRNAAQAELVKLGRPAATILRQLKRETLSPEQATRIETLLAQGAPDPGIRVEQLRGNLPFLVDCLSCSDASVGKAAAAELAERTGRTVIFDPSAPLPERRAAAEQLRDQLTQPSQGGAGRASPLPQDRNAAETPDTARPR